MALITISRGSMSGGEALAQCLAKRLNYPILGREVVVDAAARLGVPEETLARKFERSPGLWGRLTSDRRVYVVAVQAALAEHAVEGDLVYHGYAGHLLLKDIRSVLRVRLIAPTAIRVQGVMEKHQLSRDEAVDYIRHVDDDRIRWTKFIYGVDWSDPSLYDMVLNLENASIASACEIVTHAAVQVEYATTPEVRTALKDFVLGCRVRVALAANQQTRGIEVDVRAKDGVVEITGNMPAAGMLTHASSRAEDEIFRTARGVEGVKQVLLSIDKYDAYH
jgi:cytidylate kinase